MPDLVIMLMKCYISYMPLNLHLFYEDCIFTQVQKTMFLVKYSIKLKTRNFTQRKNQKLPIRGKERN